MDNIREKFKTNLIRLRGKRSIKEVSADSSIPYRTLQNMENGIIPQATNLEKISNYYKVTIGELFLDPDHVGPSKTENEPTIAQLGAKLDRLESLILGLSSPAATPTLPADIAEIVDLLKKLHKIELNTTKLFLQNIIAEMSRLGHAPRNDSKLGRKVK